MGKEKTDLVKTVELGPKVHLSEVSTPLPRAVHLRTRHSPRDFLLSDHLGQKMR